MATYIDGVLLGNPGEATAAALAAKGGRLVFSSDLQATVAITDVAGDKALPAVTIPAGAIPPGATISRVLAAVSWRKQVESGAVAGGLNGAQVIEVDKTGGFPAATAINLPDGSLATAASATENGLRVVGDNDLGPNGANEVDGADTYEFQWTAADAATGVALTFQDWQCHLLMEYE